MNAAKLIATAPAMPEERWLDRLDKSASLLFLHGYITPAQRTKITNKIEKTLENGVKSGEIIVK